MSTLTDEEFEAELSRVLDSHATVEPVEEDRALADGDWAEIEFKGEVKDLAQTVTEEGVTNSRSRADHGRGCADRDRRQEYAAGVQRGAARSEGRPGADVRGDYPADFGERGWRARP